MRHTRYFTELLPGNPDPHHASQLSEMSKYARAYHWVRLDNSTILGFANVRLDTMARLTYHPKICLFPSVHLKTIVKDHMTARGHSTAYNSLALAVPKINPTDTTADIMGKLIDAGYSMFEPDW